MELWLGAWIDQNAIMLKKFWFQQIRSHPSVYAQTGANSPSHREAGDVLNHGGVGGQGGAGGGATDRAHM